MNKLSLQLGAFAALFGLLATPALATSSLARTSQQIEDRSTFIDQVRKARQGATESQWLVGSTYVKLGRPARAISLLRSAAEAGHPRAAALLGYLCEEGRGTEKSIEEAMRWYRVASDLGQADAMGALGRLLLQQPEASAEASRLLQQAAQLGDTTGQYYLGWLLVQRNAETSDAGQAYAWFSKAAAQGHLGAQVAVAVHLLEGRGVGKDVKIARQWLERAAEKQDPIAHYLLARLSGDAGQGGLDKARSSFRIAATAGHREAQFALATILAESMVEADRNEAAEWFAKADEAGHKAAANSLGELYRDGRVLRQMERARSIFQRAAEHGDANAMYNLAHMLNMGLGGPQDTVGALKWYARAAEEGHEKALETVSDLLDSSLKTSALGLRGFWQ